MFLKPEAKFDTDLQLKVTHEADVIFKEYARYIGISPDELFVKIALEKMVTDKEFLKSVENQRYNKKIMKFLKERKLGMFSDDTENIDDEDVPF